MDDPPPSQTCSLTEWANYLCHLRPWFQRNSETLQSVGDGVIELRRRLAQIVNANLLRYG